MKYLFVFFILTLLGCQDFNSKFTADEIIDHAIAYSNKTKLDSNALEFAFRNYNYSSTPTCDGLKLERESKIEPIRDVLLKDELTRYKNDSVVNLADTTAFKYYESVNSVHYFMQLPLRLKDEAVNLTNLGTEEIGDDSYYKLKITFSENGGGVDFEDVYIYWFNTEDFSMDYLAYSFLINGGGLRFRKAINRRVIDGVVFQDYENFKSKEKTKDLENIGQMYDQDQLELLSLIENEDIKLSPIDLDCN